ncbi:MAG TPA: zf-HC2 domain-containing protein [Thermoanaerobaculia bacterium]|nr:zf-HC2 domain-containing protein [Thermoanaerobaculia bacterium]
MGHEARGHEELELLLPWYVNGTLEAAERAALDDHLAGCPRCRAELAREEGLAAALRAAEDVAPAPHPAQLARLLSRLDGEPRAERPPRRRPAAHLAALWAGTPRPVRWAVAAQTLLVLALAAATGWRAGGADPARETAAVETGGAEFRTLADTASETPAAAPAGAARLRVLFAEETSARAVRAILERVGGRIVDGPSPLGVYTVEVPAGPAADPLEVVLDHLRAQPEVRFAGEAAGGGT